MLKYEYSVVQVSIGILANWYKPEVLTHKNLKDEIKRSQLEHLVD